MREGGIRAGALTSAMPPADLEETWPCAWCVTEVGNFFGLCHFDTMFELDPGCSHILVTSWLPHGNTLSLLPAFSKALFLGSAGLLLRGCLTQA